MVFKKGSKTPKATNGRPATGGQPEGGYGSGGTPGRAQKMSAQRGDGLRMTSPARKPKGGYGTHGKPMEKKPKVKQGMGRYAGDNMSWPKATLDKLKKSKLFNLPRVKITGGG